MSKKDKLQELQSLAPADATICESTQKMLAKAHRDGVETAFDRAAAMKACPIGEKSACCKHCAMGPCRLNAKDPYSKVGVCGATIDTIQSRNFARMVASGTASHTDHGMEMLNSVQRRGERPKSKTTRSATPRSSSRWPASWASPPRDARSTPSPATCAPSWKRPTPRSRASCPSSSGLQPRPRRCGARPGWCPGGPCARSWRS